MCHRKRKLPAHSGELLTKTSIISAMWYDLLFVRDTFANFPQISSYQNPSSNLSCEMSFLSQTCFPLPIKLNQVRCASEYIVECTDKEYDLSYLYSCKCQLIMSRNSSCYKIHLNITCGFLFKRNRLKINYVMGTNNS